MTQAVPSRLIRGCAARRTASSAGWNRIGVADAVLRQDARCRFRDAVVHYRTELLRLIAQMGLGTGALAVIGGTVAIVGFLTLSTGALVAVQGYNQLASVGVEALTGFASAFFNVRLIAPGPRRSRLSATIGAGATAQLGAMRINEEIDALEVIGIRTVAYLASTRVMAGVIVVIPLYCVAVMMAFLAARFGTTAIYGQGSGVYDHYFNTFLNPDRPDLVVRPGRRDGRRDHAGAHLLRLHRVRRAGRGRRGGRPRGAHLAGRSRRS